MLRPRNKIKNIWFYSENVTATSENTVFYLAKICFLTLKGKSWDSYFALVKQEKRAMSDQFLFQQFLQQQMIEKEAKGSSVKEEPEEIQRYSAYNFSSF